MNTATSIRSCITLGALLALFPAGGFAQEKQADWPLNFQGGEYQVQVFKPQPETFDGTSFTARAAVAIQRPQDSNPVFGAVWGNGSLAVDRSDRMGTLTSFKVTDARFPGMTDAGELDHVKAMLSEGITANAPPIALDWLVGALEEEKQSNASYDNSVPQIIYRDKPSILVFIDGDPIYEAVKAPAGADPVYAQSAPAVERVVNSPYFLVRPKGGEHWLYGSGLWYSARNIAGPWVKQDKAPADLERLAQQVDTTSHETRTDGIIPEVVVTTTPAVLLDVNGKPDFQPFNNSSLMYVTNSDKDLFLDIPTQEYYFLASGRWYATKDIQNGPWRFVPSDALPADFAKVPEGSAKDGILAHVAGTPAAREAVRDASIPQTAQVQRSTASVEVFYDGAPEFSQIPGTNIYSAQNASTTVLRINGTYHVCDNAVWFEGNSPDGPWTVSTSVPKEVNDIPASDPAYRVRYVYIYDYTPEVVFTGYTPGYLGSYVQGGTVIYGTGYYYRPWHGAYWYPRPYTWGFNMYYNPWYGWGFSAGWGYDWFYPRWNYYGYYRPYSWGWWGPYAYCPGIVHQHHHGYYGHRGSMSHPRAAAGAFASGYRAGQRNADLYQNHARAGVRATEVKTAADQRRQSGLAEGSRTRSMAPIKGDHFTDSRGNVYRKDGSNTEILRDGRWEKMQPDRTATEGTTGRGAGNAAVPQRQPDVHRDQAPGRPATQPAPGRTVERGRNPGQIEQERNRGEQRTNDYRNYRQQPSRQPAPSRPSMPSTPQRNSAPSVRPAAPAPAAPGRSAPAPSRGGGNGGARRSPR